MSDGARNVLFIMADQLRWDYLSCAQPGRVATPNIDALAARGVRFDRAYVQSPICGPSRMSTYTGTYVRTHGSTWNDVPLRADEWTLGDYLRPLGHAHATRRQDAHARRSRRHRAAGHRSRIANPASS
jgi:arylsulfatase A-like enzyme